MRIGIDATALLLRSAGVKSFIYYWLEALRREAGEGDTILTFPVPGRVGKLDHERSMAGWFRTALGLGALHALNISRLPWTFPRLDIFHASTHWQNPPRGVKLTTTIHDMTCWIMPEMHSAGNVAVTRWSGINVQKRADGIITVSENTRRDVIRILDVEPSRIAVIYAGVPEPFFHVAADEVHTVRAKFGLQRPYVLFVGTVEPRKNISGLLEAYRQLSATTRAEHELVVAGPIGWADKATIAGLRGSAEGVRYLGYVSEADLPAMTAGAAVLAYPSLYEGFGLPVAQAMAAGTAVLTSNNSALPEVAGDAALLVDPHSTTEIRDALERLLTSPSLRERLGGAGRVRAQQYRWETVARSSLAWFHKMAG